MVLFPAIGLLLWIAALFAGLVLASILWFLCQSMLWLLDLKDLLTRRKNAAASRRKVPPAHKPAARELTSDMMPKWTAAHRRYVDGQLSHWQEQFDALNSRKL
ncbi:hypothetical protein [Arthrobacter sp. ISL-72]|uniref:hypothetical protein n=1 Tax=Arthrobacter sp. ISL-72 TaxID=2819114 RepID=UPI001BE8E680|nr:hypothetical protein [Arthrobacter sp. ISL-72]MBT2596271.1 hypothetical protein [Arthrobacter sp. ISL-72]